VVVIQSKNESSISKIERVMHIFPNTYTLHTKSKNAGRHWFESLQALSSKTWGETIVERPEANQMVKAQLVYL